MKRKLVYLIMTTMILGTVLTGCKSGADTSTKSQETTEGSSIAEPETGNFQELQVESNVEIEIEEGEEAAGS